MKVKIKEKALLWEAQDAEDAVASKEVAMLLTLDSIWAQSGQCGFVKDPDRQAYCRATTGGGSGQCGFIRDNDLQALCRAETGGGSSQCGFIRDSDKQAECRARVK